LQTVVLGQYDVADIGSASQILTTSLSQYGARVITAFETVGTSGQPRLLWQAGTLNPETRQAMVSSLLPLELDLIVQGCADGRLRQSSLIQMIGDSGKPSQPEKASAPALNGFLTSLNFVQNPRTKEQFIIGGGDDGSIAFWTVE